MPVFLSIEYSPSAVPPPRPVAWIVTLFSPSFRTLSVRVNLDPFRAVCMKRGNESKAQIIRASLCRDGTSEISRDPRTKHLQTRRESLARPSKHTNNF